MEPLEADAIRVIKALEEGIERLRRAKKKNRESDDPSSGPTRGRLGTVHVPGSGNAGGNVAYNDPDPFGTGGGHGGTIQPGQPGSTSNSGGGSGGGW